MIKVSVIIPVYNAEKTIRDTLLSVIGQSVEDMEIILIDDCSADATVDVIKETAAGDPRVILLRNSSNLGVSETRNKGIAEAQGEYIRFVDDDDPLPEGSVSSMLEVADANGSDLVVGIMERVRSNRAMNIVATAALGARREIDKYDPDLTQNFSVCNKMFRTDIIKANDIAFRRYRHAEDGLFLFEYLQYAERINGCNKIIYSYRRPETFEDPTSTTMLEGDMLRDIVEISDRILEIHAGAPDTFIEQFNRKIASSILIEKCYRKLWRLNDNDAAFLLKELKKYRGKLSPEIWEDVKSKHLDLQLEKGFFPKTEAAENALFTIVAAPSLKADDMIKLLRSAYYQRALLFRIVLDKSCRDLLPDELREMPNICYVDAEQMNYSTMAELCSTPYITFIEDPVIFSFETLFWAASVLRDEGTGYVSGLCQRTGDEKMITPEAYRFAFTKENLGISSACTAADRSDPMLSNKIFRTDILKDFLHGNNIQEVIEIPQLAEAMRHERSRKVRYITSCPDPYIRRKMLGTSAGEPVLPLVKLDAAGDKPISELQNKVLFVPESDEMKPSFRKLYDMLKRERDIFVRNSEPDPEERQKIYAGYRTVLFERYDPAFTPSQVSEGQNCYVLINYLCRDNTIAPMVLSELSNKV